MRYATLLRSASFVLALPTLAALSAAAAHAQSSAIIPTTHLTITPNYGTTITSDPNAGAIESSINTAISVYEARFINPITVSIDFESMTTGLGQSQTSLFGTSYANYRSALITDKAQGGDNSAFLQYLPASGNPVPGQSASSVETTSAGARALGFNSVGGVAGNYDSQISINTGLTNITRGGAYNPSNYDLQSVVFHEIDEALGVNSDLDTGFPAGYVGPTDFFRYNANGSRSYTKSTSEVSYFSVDGGATSIVHFNQGNNGDRHDWASGSGTARVQDAFGTPGSAPDLGTAELTALNVVGYNISGNASAAPEPSEFAGLGFAAFSVLGLLLRAKKRKSA